MKFKERTYGGQIFRPRPEVLFDQDGGLLLITTPWGPKSTAKKVNAQIRDQFFSSRADEEVTSPFDRLSCLTSMANDLRIAIKLVNDTIYSEENRNEYSFGFEILALAHNQNELSWIQVGYPNLFLDRANSCLLPISTSNDLSTELGHPKDPMAPLPAKLLGVDATSDFEVRSIRPQVDERFVIVSRNFLPHSFFDLSFGDRSLESISRCFASDDENTPFWIGELIL